MAYKPPKQQIDNNDVKNIPSSEAIYEALKYKIDQPTISGTAGQLLQLDGYTTDPDGILNEPITSWVNPPSAGVTSVSATAPLASSGGTTPTISLTQVAGDLDKVLVSDGTTASWQYAGLGSGNFGTDNVILGRDKPANLSGTANTIIGNGAGNAITTSTNNVLIGTNAANTLGSQGSNLVVIGSGALNRGSSSVTIGHNAGVNGDAVNVVWIGANTGNIGAAVNCIAIGREAKAGSNEFAIGSSTAQINLMLLGRGGASQTVANAVKIQTMRASGTDTNMSVGTLTIAGAQGTGTGAGGDVIIATAPPAVSSGSSLNAHVEVMRITDDGDVGIGTATPGEKLEVVGAVKADEFTVTRGVGEVYRLDPHTHDEGTETTDFTINWSNGSVHTVTLNAAGPLVITMSNPVDGGAYALRVIQGATPGTVTWPANVKWPGGNPPVLSTNTGDIDVVNLLYYSDTATYYATFALAFA